MWSDIVTDTVTFSHFMSATLDFMLILKKQFIISNFVESVREEANIALTQPSLSLSDFPFGASAVLFLEQSGVESYQTILS